MKTKNKLFKNFKDDTTEKLNLIKKIEKLNTSAETIEFLVNNYISKNKEKLQERLNSILKVG